MMPDGKIGKHARRGRHAQGLDALLCDRAFDGEARASEPFAAHTTYRIGGPARYFVRVDSQGALSQLIEACDGEGVPWVLVGKGSNLLVSDDGFDGVAISLGRDFRSYDVDEEEGVIDTGAGVLLPVIVQEAFRRSLAGLEFAVGTPGTMGGAIRMNAGSADRWIGSCIRTVTVYSPRKGLQKLRAEDVEWGYRTTSFDPEDAILSCRLELTPGDSAYIHGKMEANLKRRKSVQPLFEPSCGSVFKNPEGESAGKLIDSAGCKGLRIGGAEVSEMHANFIVNKGGATAQDVRDVMSLVQEKVKEKHGVALQPEVRFLGF